MPTKACSKSAAPAVATARYDARAGVADWDYSMKLVEMGDASVIHVRQFM
jgi:hypothetical protein